MLLPSPENVLAFFSEEPLARSLQALLVFGALALVFLVFAATRDILCRTRSLPLQIFCILLVAALPLVGFLLYLLLRPTRTLVERETAERIMDMHRMLKELCEKAPAFKLQLPNKSQVPILKSTLVAQGVATRSIPTTLKPGT